MVLALKRAGRGLVGRSPEMGRKCLGGHFEGGGGGEEKGKEGNRDEVRQKGGKTWINKLACGVHRIGS